MRKYSYTVLMMLICFYQILSADIKLIEKIIIHQDDDNFIQQTTKIAVTEDEYFIFPDRKAGNIKIFNNKGKLVKLWGRKGMGPTDFAYPVFCDYIKPKFILLDFGKYKATLYERVGILKFKKVNDIFVHALGSEVKIYNNEVMIAGYKVDKQKKGYQLYSIDLSTKDTTYILPTEVKYGYDTYKAFRKDYAKKIAPLGLSSFFDFYGGHIYLVWEANLKVLKIERKTNDIVSFGHQTKNYIKPEVTSRLRKMQREKSLKMYQERQKMSYVTGIFAEKEYIGLIYSNFDQSDSFWKSTLQIYRPNGDFVMEKELTGAYAETQFAEPSSFYNKANKMLYFLSRTSDEEFDDLFAVLKYKIELTE